MAYPRRRHDTLAPPRPFFLADSDSDRKSRRISFEHPLPPPSAFPFPFQSYPGNPDPGLSIPGLSSRRASLDSALAMSAYNPLSHSGSLVDLRKSFQRSPSSNSIYRSSVAANISRPNTPPLPHKPSVPSFRAPFLAPSSRPGSSLWSPPTYNTQLVSYAPSPNASATALPSATVSKTKPPLPSTRLAAPIDKSEKPWLSTPERGTRSSYWSTLVCILLGLAGAAILCWRGVSTVLLIDESKLCLVLSEDFSSQDLDTSTWTKDIELGGFGNGEFQMTTDSSNNLFLSNGQLYIMPTLTSDSISAASVLDGGNFTLEGCTSANKTACSVESNASLGTVINPVQSARITTQGKKNIKFGKVEIRAKMPTGDWLWPAIWMLPESNTYGAWPASGEIDIVEARGNGPTYPAQGSNFVRSSLNYGPFPTVLNQIYGWFSLKRSSFSQSFHTYTLEWDSNYMRFYTDSRLHTMLSTTTTGKKKSFWDKAGFPLTAVNGSSGAQVVVTDPWSWSGDMAPFDQSFYLIIDLAAGGTSGWFPDNQGDKPWYDGSLTAMRDFALAQDVWSATWPSNQDDRAFRIDYVKMWEKC